MARHLFLASASPRRREILAAMGIDFTLRPVDVDERRLDGEAPAGYVLRLARAKARAGAVGLPRGVVLGADTIVVLDGEILGKPADEADARASLDRLRGRAHLVATGVALVEVESGRLEEGVAWTVVHLRAFSDAERDAYVATGDPLDKAGAYAIQHPSFRPVARIVGSRTNVVGLPKELVAELLARLDRRP